MFRALIVNYPLYLPDIQGQGNTLMRNGDVSGAIQEYEKLSSLGSPSASTVLAYLYLCGAIDGIVDLEKAERLCSKAAYGGYAYAQYVLGCVRSQQGKNLQAYELFKGAAEQDFLPARLEIGRRVALGIGFDVADQKLGERVLWRTHELGHVTALLAIGAIYLFGKKQGVLKRGMGVLLYLIAALRYVIQMNRDPFCEEILSFIGRRKQSFFIKKVKNETSTLKNPTKKD